MSSINSVEDLKNNYELIVHYRKYALNLKTYKYSVPVSKELYSTMQEQRTRHDSNELGKWCKNNNLAYCLIKGNKYGVTINYETDEESVDFETTEELHKKTSLLNDTYTQWVDIDADCDDIDCFSSEEKPLLQKKME